MVLASSILEVILDGTMELLVTVGMLKMDGNGENGKPL